MPWPRALAQSGGCPSSSWAAFSGTSGGGEQLVEDRKDLGRARHAAHGKVLVTFRDLLIAVPDDGVAETDLLTDLDIGEVLAHGQQVVLDEIEAVPHVVGDVVAVGGLGGV